MVELSASSVVCLAICAIRLTTLPIAAEDSRSRSTLRLASRAAAPASIGELAGVAHLGADSLRRMGELVGGLRERGRGVLGGAGAPGQGVGALADGGERRRRRLGAAGDRIGRALELPDHRAEFEFEQFEDFAGGIAGRVAGGIGRRPAPASRGRRLDGRRSRFRQTSSKQAERHGPLSANMRIAVASSHPGMKSWLTIASYAGSGHYRDTKNAANL